MDLNRLRQDFERDSNRAVSMPVAGIVIWLLVGLISLTVEFQIAVFVVLFATGGIFPIALLVAHFRKEKLLSSQNPLAKLMGLCVLMVNLLRGLHIPLVLSAPKFVPLSIGIGLGLHWVVYSWIVQHPVGIIHGVLRTLAVVAVWYVFGADAIAAVSFAIVAVYWLSIGLMLTRPIN